MTRDQERQAVDLLHRWRRMYADLGFPDHEDGELFSRSGMLCADIYCNPPLWTRIRRWLTWATVEEATDMKPLARYKVFFRRIFNRWYSL